MGAGINLFKTLFPSDYYPYTANTLMSCKPLSKVIKDSNNQTVATVNFSGTELRGLLKVGTDGLYADGDTDDGSGTGAVRYGIVDLGSLNWGYENGVFQAYYEAFKGAQADNLIGNYLCPDYLASNAWTVFGGSANKVFYISNDHYIRVVDNDYSDSATFKTANSGVYMQCELATPTTQTISAWTNPIVAKEGGTETFVDTRTIALPTGHDTIYGTDLSVNKAEFGTTVYGGSVDFTTGEVISNKNADGTDKTAETIAISPVMVGVFEGDNNIVTDAQGSNTVKYFKKG